MQGAYALQVLPKLRRFTLHVDCTRLHVMVWDNASITHAERSLDDFDRRAFSIDLFGKVPSLDIVELMSAGMKNVPRWKDELFQRAQIMR